LSITRTQHLPEYKINKKKKKKGGLSIKDQNNKKTRKGNSEGCMCSKNRLAGTPTLVRRGKEKKRGNRNNKREAKT